MKGSIVLTTINKPNINIKKLTKLSKKNKFDLIIIGDLKTPNEFKLNHGFYFDIYKQKKLKFDFAKKCPVNSYARKNIGYLISFKNGSETIIETDDDNYPKDNFLKFLKLEHTVYEVKEKSWVNVYFKFLTNKIEIWPRGLPLDKIDTLPNFKIKKIKKNFFLKQGVCEGNPDVDAIYRIMNENINIKFKDNYKFSLGNAFCPINSQNTIWSKKIFPLMYLPITCTMRATDIWRGMVALNIMQNDNQTALFFGTTMFQNRNIHNLSKDLKDEIPEFKNIHKAYKILKNLKLKKGSKNYSQNLIKSYEALIKNRIFKKKEMYFLKSWIKDLKTCI
tara:strand:- start:686 stop:1687 length:1002 start_codon:yes stop_codon:yes gene_type:complete